MSEINLEEIANKNLFRSELNNGQYVRVRAAMIDAIRQALELAAENAEIKLICSNPDCRNESYNSLHEYSCCDKCYSIMEESVDKESITGIINQVV